MTVQIAKYSYHDLVRYWDGKQYVDRPFDGPKSMLDMIAKIESELESKGKLEFIRQYITFPWSVEDAQAASLSHHDSISVTFIHNNRLGEQEVQSGHPRCLYDDLEADINWFLDSALTPTGIPELAYIVFTMESRIIREVSA